MKKNKILFLLAITIVVIFICFFEREVYINREIVITDTVFCANHYAEQHAQIFIAHAGGAIEGFTYTNCVEAMNLSYSKGCKLFELDLIETSDGKIVAAHDWIHYKQITGYSGTIDDTPLTEAEFMLQKIYGKYTPMNISAINEWFAQHQDAILVTDKINSPQKIAAAFLFKSRCIMELFSWEAVEEALSDGVITPMPSENLVFGASYIDVEKKLLDWKISHITFSRRSIAANAYFLTNLKEQGIKIYVYHVNCDAGKDEGYVFSHELDKITGMYADNLDLLQQLNNYCEK